MGRSVALDQQEYFQAEEVSIAETHAAATMIELIVDSSPWCAFFDWLEDNTDGATAEYAEYKVRDELYDWSRRVIANREVK
jgi:hypothetical protein